MPAVLIPLLLIPIGIGSALTPAFSQEEVVEVDPESYSKSREVKLEGPDRNFFSTIRAKDLPEKTRNDGKACKLQFKFKPGQRDFYLVVTEGEAVAETPMGKNVVRHRMEVLLSYEVESMHDGSATIRQKVRDFYVTGRRPLLSAGGGKARNLLIRKRMLGDQIKVWSGGKLIADSTGFAVNPEAAGIVKHLTSEILRMTGDIKFEMDPRGATKIHEGPDEFVALFRFDFGSPFGVVLPEKLIKPGVEFSREEKSPLTEIIVSGKCGDHLQTAPVGKRTEYRYLGMAKVGKYDCAVFKISQDQTYRNLDSHRKTPYGVMKVIIESVHIRRDRKVYFCPSEGKLVAYDACQETEADFAVKTPLGGKSFKTKGSKTWTMMLHDGVTIMKSQNP